MTRRGLTLLEVAWEEQGLESSGWKGVELDEHDMSTNLK